MEDRWLKQVMEIFIGIIVAIIAGLVVASFLGWAHGGFVGVIIVCMFFLYNAVTVDDIPLYLIISAILAFSVSVYISVGLGESAATGGIGGGVVFLASLLYVYFKKVK